MATTRSQWAQLLSPGLNKVMYKWLKDHPEEYPAFYGSVDDAKGEAWHDTQLTAGLGLMRSKQEGAPPTFDDPIQGGTHRIYVKTYSLGWQITREMIEDERYGLMKKVAQGLMRSAKLTIESLCAAPLNLATSTTVCGDGLAMLHTAHPILGPEGGTWSNLLSPYEDISVTAFQDIFNLSERAIDERGQPAMIAPTDLWIPPELQWATRVVLQTQLAPGTGNNDINTMQGRLSPHVLHFLTSTTSWFVSSKDNNELTAKWSVRPQSYMYDDPQTLGVIHHGRFRLGVGIPEARGWFGSV